MTSIAGALKTRRFIRPHYTFSRFWDERCKASVPTMIDSNSTMMLFRSGVHSQCRSQMMQQQQQKRHYLSLSTTSIERSGIAAISARVPFRKITTGESLYREALSADKKANEIRLEKERQKSTEMYNAWQRATEKQKQFDEQQQEKNSPRKRNTNRSGGVAVVKTIAKQARKEKERAHNNNNKESNDEKDEKYWKQLCRKLLDEAALKHNHPEALVQLGNLVLEERDQTGDESFARRAMDLYQTGGEQGCAEGWFNLGQMLWTGYPSGQEGTQEQEIPCDREASMQAFWKAIDAGDLDAMYFVGVQVLSMDEDDGSHVDNSKAIASIGKGLELIQAAAKENHGGALHYLSLLYLNGNESLDVSRSEEKFMDYLNDAVTAGDSDAPFLRGCCYLNADHGYRQDCVKALDDFLLAAHLGNADAAVSAGAMMHSGKYPGVARDQSKAFNMYQLGGELGSVEGWRNVVACYLHGEGVPQSKETAKYIANTMLKNKNEDNELSP